MVLTTLADQERRAEGMATITVEDRVYLDAQGKATTDPAKGVSLWSTPGSEVPEEEAEAVGYKAKAVSKPKGTKVVEGPGGDK